MLKKKSTLKSVSSGEIANDDVDHLESIRPHAAQVDFNFNLDLTD